MGVGALGFDSLTRCSSLGSVHVLERDVRGHDVERSRVDRAADPFEEIVVVLVAGIGRGEQQLLVASSAA